MLWKWLACGPIHTCLRLQTPHILMGFHLASTLRRSLTLTKMESFENVFEIEENKLLLFDALIFT